MNIGDKKNYIYNIVYRLSICVLPLVVTPYISRVLGAEQVGIYSFSSTVACYFIMFAKLGIDSYGNRSIASCREDRTRRSVVFFSIYGIQIITSLVVIGVYFFLIQRMNQEVQMVYYMQLMYVSSVLFDVSWFFFGMEKFKLTTIRSLISRAMIIILVFLLVRGKEDLMIYTGIMSACFLLEQIQLIIFLPKYIDRIKITVADMLLHIKPNIKLFLPLVAISIFNWMDKLLLGVMIQGAAVVAFYVYAENIINLPKGILLALDSMMLPKQSSLVAKGRLEESLQQLRRGIQLNGFLCSFLCFGIAGVAHNFIPWFFGSEYIPSVNLTMYLSIAMIPMSISSGIQYQYLIPHGKEKLYSKAVYTGAAINLGLNLMLIPHFGVYGVVCSKLITELWICVYQIYGIGSVYSFSILLKDMGPFLLIGVIEFLLMVSLPFLVHMDRLELILLQIVIGGTTYLVGSYCYIRCYKKRTLVEILRNSEYKV